MCFNSAWAGVRLNMQCDGACAAAGALGSAFGPDPNWACNCCWACASNSCSGGQGRPRQRPWQQPQHIHVDIAGQPQGCAAPGAIPIPDACRNARRRISNSRRPQIHHSSPIQEIHEHLWKWCTTIRQKRAAQDNDMPHFQRRVSCSSAAMASWVSRIAR